MQYLDQSEQMELQFFVLEEVSGKYKTFLNSHLIPFKKENSSHPYIGWES